VENARAPADKLASKGVHGAEKDALVAVQRVEVDFHGSEDSDAAVGQFPIRKLFFRRAFGPDCWLEGSRALRGR
jgi:hypothetical protein